MAPDNDQLPKGTRPFHFTRQIIAPAGMMPLMPFSSCHFLFLTIALLLFQIAFSAAKFYEVKRLQSAGKCLGVDGSETNERKKGGKAEPPKAKAPLSRSEQHEASRKMATNVRIHWMAKTSPDNAIWTKPNSIRIRKLGQSVARSPNDAEDGKDRKGPIETKQNEVIEAETPLSRTTIGAKMKISRSQLMHSLTKARLTSSPKASDWQLMADKTRNGMTKYSSRPTEYGGRKKSLAQRANSPPEKADPLQMTRENCQKMKRYATSFGVSNPSEWVRSNCLFLRMYVRFSCDDIGTFVSSCSKYEKNEKKGNGKARK
ncbi:hypothetical protein niasHS_003513 [Heterodera schachtii]|uniref:aECM cysteine-cradle domain-containing protein n=1 Tax=Heterodera schachtii TaxID=97005 RepID=A0ABD2KGQ9_HETSC